MRRLLATLLALGLIVTADAQRLIVTDSGSTEREVSRLVVIDSGGTAREIQRLFVVDSGGVSRLVYSGLSVSPDSNGISKVRFGNTCYAGVRFQIDGSEDTLGPTNSWAGDRGNWLDAGSPGDVWVERIVNSGSLNNSDPGAGRLQLSSEREYSVIRTSVGTQSANVTFNFYDSSSGGNLLATVTYTISAEFTN